MRSRERQGRRADGARKSTKATEEKEQTTKDLYLAWGLTIECLGTHVSHHLHQLGLHEYAHGEVFTGKPVDWATIASLACSVWSRYYPRIVAFKNGSPTMNSLVGVGAVAAFTLSGANALHPVLNEYGMPQRFF